VKDEKLEKSLDKNPCQTQLELANTLRVTQQDISYRLKQLGRIRKESWWVPHELTPENKSRRHDTALSLLSRFKKKDFLHKIVTCDEKWILYGNPKR
jgi:histone-lysine N-methyltransferase SETMAR